MSLIKKTISRSKKNRPPKNTVSSVNPNISRQIAASNELLERSFQNQSLIGRGSFGEVFSASWTEKKHQVAVKKVQIKQEKSILLSMYRSLRSNQLKNLPDLSKLVEPLGKMSLFTKYDANELPQERTEPTEKRSRKEMEREIKIWKKLQKKGNRHYGLLFLHQALFIENECWLVMDLCAKGNLYFFVKNFVYDRMFPLTLDICLELAAPIYSALRYMHGIGIIHRDVKPENILLTDSFEPKLGDFTLCADMKKDDKVKYVDSYSGTPTYSPPESFFGEYYNTTWDSWSMVCLILYLKFGKVCWNMKGNNVKDETIVELFSETCYNKMSNLGTDDVEAVEHEYMSKMFVVPRNDYVQQNSEDDFPWCETRMNFSVFAKQCLKWDMKQRLTCEAICETDLFKERVALWDRSPKYAAIKLKEKIDSWIDDKTFLDDKWLIF